MKIPDLLPSSWGVYQFPSRVRIPGYADASRRPMQKRSAYSVLTFLAAAMAITRKPQSNSRVGSQIDGRIRVMMI